MYSLYRWTYHIQKLVIRPKGLPHIRMMELVWHSPKLFKAHFGHTPQKLCYLKHVGVQTQLTMFGHSRPRTPCLQVLAWKNLPGGWSCLGDAALLVNSQYANQKALQIVKTFETTKKSCLLSPVESKNLSHPPTPPTLLTCHDRPRQDLPGKVP